MGRISKQDLEDIKRIVENIKFKWTQEESENNLAVFFDLIYGDAPTDREAL